MVNYKNAMIYVIRSYQTDNIYIGSTCNELRKRLFSHKTNYKLHQQGRYNFNTSFEIIKYDDAYIELYEKYPCNDKLELHKREGQIIRKLDCVNKLIAGNDRKEYEKQYYIDNKEKYQKRGQTEKYKSKSKATSSQKVICICGIEGTQGHISHHKKTKFHRIFMFKLHNELNHLGIGFN